MNHNKNGNGYNDNFRKMIVELYHSGQKVKDLSRRFQCNNLSMD